MTKKVWDVTSELVVPYLIHFSKKGVVPKVLEIKDYVITMEKIPGERLGDLIRSSNLALLEILYARVGRGIAYVNKFNVGHGDFHLDNVVVNGLNPFIIDWETAHMFHPDDSAGFIDSTGRRLDEANRLELLVPLEKSFKRAYEQESAIPRDVTKEEIHRVALEEFGFA